MSLRRQNLHSSAVRREVSDHGICDQMRFQESKPRGRLPSETVEENCERLHSAYSAVTRISDFTRYCLTTKQHVVAK
jgi:hypothetical protein